MGKNKFSALASLLLVFLSGTLVGAVSYRLYMVNTVNSGTLPKRDPEEVRKRRINEMRDRVKLDEPQVAKLNEIYDHTRESFHLLKKQGDEQAHGIWDKHRESIRAILRPDQLPLYDQYQKEQDEARRRRMEKEGKK